MAYIPFLMLLLHCTREVSIPSPLPPIDQTVLANKNLTDVSWETDQVFFLNDDHTSAWVEFNLSFSLDKSYVTRNTFDKELWPISGEWDWVMVNGEPDRSKMVRDNKDTIEITALSHRRFAVSFEKFKFHFKAAPK